REDVRRADPRRARRAGAHRAWGRDRGPQRGVRRARRRRPRGPARERGAQERGARRGAPPRREPRSPALRKGTGASSRRAPGRLRWYPIRPRAEEELKGKILPFKKPRRFPAELDRLRAMLDDEEAVFTDADLDDGEACADAAIARDIAGAHQVKADLWLLRAR